ncbi:hypothetical protein [Flavobacterium sp. HTF]|uniref:hypothetical protein n=1 Tax=Flavobacterium sp. HTF TaxID=2170732 RepID=UPI001A9C503E|nr:hypothetical protein [Flavobacterium sp. HTF]
MGIPNNGEKIILHLCADLGSDTRFFKESDDFKVIMVGESIGVENYVPPKNVYGVVANPVCTQLSTASGFHKQNDVDKGMFLVNHCIRIIKECNPKWWVIENPANGRLKDVLGKPNYVYQPWQFGSPWTKKTALWTGGDFVMPDPIYNSWADVPKNEFLYVRPNRPKPALAFLHKSAIKYIPEFEPFKSFVKNDADFRSLCSQGFAQAMFVSNSTI